MEPLLQVLSQGSAAAVSGLIAAVWEGAVLAAGVALVLRLVPRLSAAARSAIWLNAFALLVLLNVLPLLHGNAPSPAAITGPRFDLDWRWSAAIAGVWVGLSAWRVIGLASNALRLRGLARRAVAIEADESTTALLMTSRGGRIAQLCTSEEVARPSVLGFFRPRILLPPRLVEKLTPDELRQVVLHEMEHLRRGDDWTNLLQKIALVVLPLNPVLIWVERRLCAERELACDDRVLEAGGASKAYAMCLTRLAEFSMLQRSVSLVLGAWEHRPELARRVHRLLRNPRASMHPMQARFAVGALMAALAGASVVLARSPQLVEFAPPARTTLAANSGADHADRVIDPAGLRPGYRAINLMAHPGQALAVPASAEGTKPAAAIRLVARKPARKHEPMRLAAASAAPQVDRQPQQTFMVLTEWDDADAAPRPLLLKLDAKGVYAALPVNGGWLIVKI